MLGVILSGLILLLLWWRNFALASLQPFPRVTSASPNVTAAVSGLLVLVVLVVAVNPEIRVFLLLLDAIGVDLFVLLLAFQARQYLQLIHDAVIVPTAQRLSMWGPYPMPLPTRWLLAQHPFWSAYATLRMMAMVVLFALAVIGVVSAVASMISWPAGKAAWAVTVRSQRRAGEVDAHLVNRFRGRGRRRWWPPVPRSAPGRLD